MIIWFEFLPYNNWNILELKWVQTRSIAWLVPNVTYVKLCRKSWLVSSGQKMTSIPTSTNIVSLFQFGTNFSLVQYYLPPKTQVNKDFLWQVFAEEKILLKKKNVEYVHVSHYQELSVKNLWKDLKDDQIFNVYFQDKYAD